MSNRNCQGVLLIGLTLIATVFSPPSAFGEEKSSGFHWTDNPTEGIADLLLGEEHVVRYMYGFDRSDEQRTEETTKVYHHVFGPGTDTIITKGPGGLYPHHRGLFVGWKKTIVGDESYDFWHCREGIVHQRHVRFIEMRSGDESGSMTAEIQWNDPDGNPVITEKRTIDVSRAPGDSGAGYGWQIDWRTVVSSNRGEIRLEGDRQHAGFQFRAAQPIADGKGARYIRPAGFPEGLDAFQVGDDGDPPPHIDLGWLAMTYVLDEKRYTIEYFEDPALPKPSLFSERPYGRFGAFFKATVQPEKPLSMRYRIRVTSGRTPTRAAIQSRYDEFTAELASIRGPEQP